MNPPKQMIWQPSATALRASDACALIVTVVAAGSALLDVDSALLLVEVGLAASGLLLFSRVRSGERWGTAARISAWMLVATSAVVLLGRVSGASYDSTRSTSRRPAPCFASASWLFLLMKTFRGRERMIR